EAKIQELESQGLVLLQTATIQQHAIEYQASNLTQQLEQTQEEKTNLISTLVKKTQDVQTLETTIRKVESEHTSVRTKLVKDKSKLQQEVEKLKQREAQLLQEGTVLLNKYSITQAELEKLQSDHKTLEAKSLDQENEIQILQTEQKKLILNVADKENEISQLKEFINERQIRLHLHQQEQLDYTTKIATIQSENNQLKHNLNISQINETTLHDNQTKQIIEISTLQTANQSLEDKFRRLQQTIAGAASTNELEIAQHTLAIQNRKIVSLENELTELGQALQLASQAAERAAKLDTENNYLRGNIEQLNRNNQTLLEQLAQPANTIDTTNEAPRMAANDDIRALAVAITRRDETQNIPIYSGNVNDQPIGVWLRDAEAIATIHEWPRESTKKILATRLKGTALQWHIDRLRVAPRESYTDWRNALKDHFKHPADRAKQKSKLLTVKQSPNQPVRHFIDKITQAYNAIYKEGDEEQFQSAELTALKDDTLIKMLLDGLLPPIKTILFHNKYPTTANWQNFKQAALEAEEIAYNTQALEVKPVFKLDILKPTRDIEAELSQTKLELENLKNNLTKLNLSGTTSKTGQERSLSNIDTYKQVETAEQQIKAALETNKQLQTETKETKEILEKTLTEKIALRRSLIDITTKNKNLETELQKINAQTIDQEEKIKYLENRIREYRKQQVTFAETEDLDNSNEPGEITKLVSEINDLTSITEGDKSLHFELESEQVEKLQQLNNDLQNQIEIQNNNLLQLERKYQTLKNKIEMGLSHKEASRIDRDTTDTDSLDTSTTQPIVKALGELFSREDKKSIPIFKGKSTDKLITEWLKDAEHVARNNDWDDNQKIRFY
ncbi:repetitive organellar protein-like, partial [Daphnia carinata]|uniref:repetitive organellar protein-like n=1 Tax=Daphnia carinata TaxID=120202 RepID=UPI00286856B5